MAKVLFISSTGGHFTELKQLMQLYTRTDFHIITERTDLSASLRRTYGKSITFLPYGTKDKPVRYFFVFALNCMASLFLHGRLRPRVIITTGAHTAVPMCYWGKLFGCKVIFIESFANVSTRSLSGRLVYPIADAFYVQWPAMLRLYPKAKYRGRVF